MRLRKPEEYTDRGGRRAATIRGRVIPPRVSGTPSPSIPCGVSSDLTRPSLSRRCASFASRRVRVGPLGAVRQCVCVNMPNLSKLHSTITLQNYASKGRRLSPALPLPTRLASAGQARTSLPGPQTTPKSMGGERKSLWTGLVVDPQREVDRAMRLLTEHSDVMGSGRQVESLDP